MQEATNGLPFQTETLSYFEGNHRLARQLVSVLSYFFFLNLELLWTRISKRTRRVLFCWEGGLGWTGGGVHDICLLPLYRQSTDILSISTYNNFITFYVIIQFSTLVLWFSTCHHLYLFVRNGTQYPCISDCSTTFSSTPSGISPSARHRQTGQEQT